MLDTVFLLQERCPYPCTCPVTGQECADCEECPRQLGEPCSEDRICDIQRGLICRYRHGDAEGVCRGKRCGKCFSVHFLTHTHTDTNKILPSIIILHLQKHCMHSL